jgi:PKD repeat protein
MPSLQTKHTPSPAKLLVLDFERTARTRTIMRKRTALIVVLIALTGCTDGFDPLAVAPDGPRTDIVASSAMSVNLSGWAAESYAAVSGFGAGNWNVSTDGASVFQSVNGQPTLFYSDFAAFKTEVRGVIRVNTTSDDDFIGFALGFRPGDATNGEAEYLLIDWKKSTQPFDFGSPSCTPGATANVGLAVSRVFGVPTADELWGHANFDSACSDADNGVEELARANTLGSTGWVSSTSYQFAFQFTATLLRVFVDDVLELEIDGVFNDGRLAFYNFSQAAVDYSAFTIAEFNNAPTGSVDDYVVAEDAALSVDASTGVLANDFDPDADPLAAVLAAGPDHGALVLTADGSFTYTPDADYNGPDAFTYVASDGDLQSADVTVSITVEPVNDAPAADGGGPYVSDEGSAIAFDGSASSDADNDPLTFGWTFGDGGSGNGATPSHTYVDDGAYTVTLIVSDGSATDDATMGVVVTNVHPAVGLPNGPVDPVPLGAETVVSASFTDPGTNDAPFNATIDWGDGTSSDAVVTEASGAGTAAGAHTYAAQGMYMVTVRVTDKDGAIGVSDATDIVIYNPEASVSGRGTINSPAGAYVPDGSLTGEARFGFVARYQNGAAIPTGRTDFVFRVADFRFVSTEYDRLVVAGPRAQYMGSGVINGEGNYGFMLTAIDGEQPGGDGVDRFRLKIWDRQTNNMVYDNEQGVGDAADPTTVLTRGRIVIRK